ncbi:hypothetical protein BCR34DRAFT_354613 [Clohesyomyces aquaticus]|uniref:DUF7580 domain-containing protein n=1 Tax=Clohesyomyces aquaticus TaxID=1231657 RepID=A0A1Y1ZJ50_9PLEO|nr:hypothetical protein BCR34DRAFT_354613 [Clohesyomyces aquaticus]
MTQGVTDDILALIVANRKDDGKHIDLIPRFKLMFGASNLTNAIDELETAVSGLNRLIHTVTRSRQPVESEPSRQTKRLAKAFRHLSSLASSLHTALGNGWSKSCHPSHNAQLFLDDRLDVLQSSKSGRHKARPAFRLVLATEAPGKESLDRLETEVHMHLDEQDLDIGRLEASSSTRVRVSFTSSHCDSDPLPTGIDDLCMALTAAQSANSANQYVAFVVSASKGRTQIATIPAPQKCLIACHQQFISLKELLSDDLTKRRIPLRSRMLLSVRLASNLLQLLNTPWLPATFSKEKIFFPATPVPKQNTPLVDFSRPFIHSEFKEDDPTAVFSQNYASPPKETLLELGILLLEIWHEQTLEERFSLDKSPVEFFDRLPLALKWAEESHTELLESYENAVCYCTGFMTGESRGSQWKDDKLWASVYGEVIEPLARNCKLWR